MTIQDAFKLQLDESEPIPAKWATMSLEECKQLNPSITTEQAAIVLDRYKKHAGQKMVYYMGYSADATSGDQRAFGIYRAWESEIDALAETWDLLDPMFDPNIPESKLPRFVKKV